MAHTKKITVGIFRGFDEAWDKGMVWLIFILTWIANRFNLGFWERSGLGGLIRNMEEDGGLICIYGVRFWLEWSFFLRGFLIRFCFIKGFMVLGYNLSELW